MGQGTTRSDRQLDRIERILERYIEEQKAERKERRRIERQKSSALEADRRD